MSDGIGSALIGALSEVLKKQPVPGMPGQPPQIGAQPQPAPAPVTNAPARIGALPAQPATAPAKIGAQPTQPSTTIGAPPVDYAAQYAAHAAERPADLDPNAGKPSMLRKIGGIATGALIGAVNPQAGGMIGRDITQGPRRELEAQQAQKMAQWNQGGADISKEASLADTQSQIAQRNAEAGKDARGPEAKPATVTHTYTDAGNNEVGVFSDGTTRVLGPTAVKTPEPKTKTLDEEYDEAVRTENTARATQIQGEMKTVAGAKREPRAPTDTESAISDYIKANKMDNTPANRLKAREAVKDKPESGAAGKFDSANAEDASKQVSSAHDADFRMRSMSDSYPKAQKGDQQAMMNLLTNHIGMTLGLQKGARITKDILQEAQKSTPWLQGVEAKFDDRGYLSGLTLTSEQMGQMMDLAKSQRTDAWQRAADSADQAGVKDRVKFPNDIKLGGAPPQGATMKVPGSDGKLHWSDGKADLGVAE